MGLVKKFYWNESSLKFLLLSASKNLSQQANHENLASTKKAAKGKVFDQSPASFTVAAGHHLLHLFLAALKIY
jgi:hypothetical protein